MAFADRLLLNKCDLVPDEEELKKVEARLRSINKFAPILRSTNSEVDVGVGESPGFPGFWRAGRLSGRHTVDETQFLMHF